MRALLILLFISLKLPAALAGTGKESLAALIESAQKKVLQKDRQGAAQQLLTALADEKLSAKSRQKILESLHNLTHMFLTDKGQRTYELAQSTLSADVEGAISRLREALILEDGNLTVATGLALALVQKEDCEGAEKALQPALALNPYDSELHLVAMRVQVCQAQCELLPKVPSGVIFSKAQEPFRKMLSAQCLYQKGDKERGVELMTELVAADPHFAEPYYWLSKWEESPASDERARKYLALCKNLNQRSRRKYYLEPRLCMATAEVEKELSKRGSNGEEP